MKTTKALDNSTTLRNLPSVDTILRSERIKQLAEDVGIKNLTETARAVLDEMRAEIVEANGRTEEKDWLAEVELRIEEFVAAEEQKGIRRVINATGVVVHTNLGRAPLSEEAKKAIAEEAAGYCTVEYDLRTGKRGRRGERVENLLVQLTSAEAAIVVNNCAAAAFLVLTVCASGGEVVISRGELVEIGGDFRVPDVLTQSGAHLHEVGTTNRTKLADYEKAISESTRMILRVHPSNYRIIGFTAMPTLAELSELARAKNILLYEDAGSGALADFSSFGIIDEPIIRESIAAGADLATFSGDKLLGGPQSGMIVGRRELIEKIRRHPLYRALRVDKLIYAALEATLKSHLREAAADDIPVLKMLSQDKEIIAGRTKQFVEKLKEKLGANSNLQIEIIEGKSAVGGGSSPAFQPDTMLISIQHKQISADALEGKLRAAQPPVIERIADGRVLIDLRTVFENEEDQLLRTLTSVV